MKDPQNFAISSLRTTSSGTGYDITRSHHYRRLSIYVLSGIRYAAKLVRRNNIDMVHARSHVPATIALALKKTFPLKMIFDVRGLMAEEYVDAEHWSKGGIPYRLTKAVFGSVQADTTASIR